MTMPTEQRYEKRESGLVVPVTPPPSPPPARYCGPLELQDPDKRTAAAKALNDLWDAMELSAKCGLGDGAAERHEAHWGGWRYLGEMVLGEDCPDREVLT